MGLRRRIDAPTWSREIHEVKDFPAPGVVTDTEGKQTLTKFARPVPRDSSHLEEKQAAPVPAQLEPFAQKLRDSLTNRGQAFSQAVKEPRAQAGFSDTPIWLLVGLAIVWGGDRLLSSVTPTKPNIK